MNQNDMFFELSPWESWVEAHYDGSITAVELLTMFENESEEALDNAFLDLEDASVSIDLSGLPRNMGTGESARRLREEEQLIREGKLLTGLEENDPLRLYLQELAAIPVQGDLGLLSQELAENTVKGRSDEGLRTRIVNLCLSRVVELAGEYTGWGVLLMDLIQEGSLGLWQGTVGFAGGNFEDCRDWWIRQYMAQAVIRQARASGLGQKMRQAVEDYRMVDERLLSELGRNPTLDEIAESMHMTVSEVETVRRLLDNARLVGKAHEVKEPEEETPEDTQAVEDTAYYQTRERVDSLMSGISELEHQVVTMRYGLDGKAPQTAQEVGRKLGLTVTEVVELETSALTKMRQSKE